jgi:hypothetical protein
MGVEENRGVRQSRIALFLWAGRSRGDLPAAFTAQLSKTKAFRSLSQSLQATAATSGILGCFGFLPNACNFTIHDSPCHSVLHSLGNWRAHETDHKAEEDHGTKQSVALENYSIRVKYLDIPNPMPLSLILP